MSLLFFSQRLTNDVIAAFCWTLLHSLWQGLIAALLAASVVMFTRKAPAATRYNLLSLLLFLLLLTTAFTFIRELGLGQSAGVASEDAAQAGQPVSISSETTAVIERQAPFEGIKSFLDQNIPVLMTIWFIFFLIKCTNLLSGMLYIQRIRHRGNGPVSSGWMEKLLELQRKVGVRRHVLLLRSEQVRVPLVVGILKPVILVPAGLMVHLPADQLEAILLHELAHIRRKDYLVNLIQSFAEAIFFFNPAVTWISSLIREEREACCDDLVVANTEHKRSYLEALVSFQEYALGYSGQAMALATRKHYLLNRVKRMLTQENKKLNLMEKTMLVTGVLAFMLFSSFMNEPEKQHHDKQGVQTAAAEMKPPHPVPVPPPAKTVAEKQSPKMSCIKQKPEACDTLPKKEHTGNSLPRFSNITTRINDDGETRKSETEAVDEQGKRYRFHTVNGEITELWVDGKPVPKESFGDYTALVRQIEQRRGQKAAEARKAAEERRIAIREHQAQLGRERELMEKQRKELRANMLAQRQNQAKLEAERKQMQAQLARENNERRVAMQYKMREDQSRRTDSMRRQQRSLAQARAAQAREHTRATGGISAIISDLVRLGLVENADALAFTLNEKELIVNGVKQPSSIHLQMKERYIDHPSDFFKYNRAGNSIQVTVNQEK
ncbi:MAG TPA: M56 family metallopeptidase [Flavisolibacter sp.]|nr:M56 family metallopeptidase [Flavisolibacter sp.]